MSLLIPSYKSGFARNAAESENPNLWKGLVGLWTPSLGPTGLTLRDWSGYGSHGTLTAMAPASDWVTNWLDFDGTDDTVIVPHHSSLDLDAAITIAGRVRLDTFVSSAALIVKGRTTGADLYNYSGEFRADGKTWGLVYREAGGAFHVYEMTQKLSGTTWHDLVVTCRFGLGDAATYLDGNLQPGAWTVGDGLGAAATNTDPLYIGSLPTDDLAIHMDGQIQWLGLWNRILAPSEAQQLYVDPHALLRLRRRVYPAAAAPVGHFGRKINRSPLFSKLQGLAG